MSLSNIYPFIYMLLRCSCEHLNIPVVKISQNKFVSIFLWTSSPYEDNQKYVKCISFCDWCLESIKLPTCCMAYCGIFTMKYPLFDLEIVLINNDLSCFGISDWTLGENGWNLIFLVNFRLCMLYYNYNIWTSVHVFVKHLMLFICSSSVNILILAAFHVFLLWSIQPFIQ